MKLVLTPRERGQIPKAATIRLMHTFHNAMICQSGMSFKGYVQIIEHNINKADFAN